MTLPAAQGMGVIGGHCSRVADNTYQCFALTLRPGDNAPGFVSINPPLANGTYAIAFQATGSLPYPNPANNSATVQLSIGSSNSNAADLNASAFAPQSVLPQQPATWTLGVRNDGSSTAFNVVAKITVPPGTQAWQGSWDSFSCDMRQVPWVCTAPYMLSGHLTHFVLQLKVPAEDGAAVPVGIVVSSDNPDPNGNNNTISAASVMLAPDLALSAPATIPAVPAAPVVFGVTIANHGTVAATHVALRATIPSGVTVASVTSPTGACTAGTTVSCTFAQLATGESAVMKVIATAPSAGAASFAFTATATESDLAPADNQATVAIETGHHRVAHH